MMFLLLTLLSDDYLKVKSDASSQIKQFFSISLRVHYDLQQLLSCRYANELRSVIPLNEVWECLDLVL